jgi:hypothetical protein
MRVSAAIYSIEARFFRKKTLLLFSLFSTAGRKSAVRLYLISRRSITVYYAVL